MKNLFPFLVAPHTRTHQYSTVRLLKIYRFLFCGAQFDAHQNEGMESASGNIEWLRIKMQSFVHFWNAFILRNAFLFCLKIHKNLNNQWVWHTFFSRFVHANEPMGTKMALNRNNKNVSPKNVEFEYKKLQ